MTPPAMPDHLTEAPCPHEVELDMCDTPECAQVIWRMEAAYEQGWRDSAAAQTPTESKET